MDIKKYDLELFQRLGSLYNGLLVSAHGPYVDLAGKSSSAQRAAASKRVDFAGEDIAKYLRYHQKLERNFSRLPELESDRKSFLQVARIIAADYLACEYLAKNHRAQYGKHSFLVAPLSDEGENFCVLEGLFDNCSRVSGSLPSVNDFVFQSKPSIFKNRVAAVKNSLRLIGFDFRNC